MQPEYRSWQQMINRCDNKNSIGFSNYGGRGIRVCDQWYRYETFLSDMGRRPTLQHSIDRIDVNGNYEPSNCRWATNTEQARNTRTRKDNTSGHRGVSWNKRKQKYEAYIAVGGRMIWLGAFRDLDAAIAARKAGEARYWGNDAAAAED